jgi:uncharacterized protein
VATRTSYDPGTPSWVDLMTPDRDAAIRFYGALFGWRFEVGPPESGHYTTCLVDGDPVAGIGETPRDADGAPAFPPAWTTYLATADVDATAKQVTDAGGTVLVPPADVMDAGRMAVAADPTGAVVGLWQPRRHTGARRVHEPGALTWTELATPDPGAAGAFYAAVFDHGRDRVDAGGVPYTTLTVAGTAVAGLMPRTDEVPTGAPAAWLAYFAVADADAAAVAAVTGGGAVLVAPVDTPYGRVAVLADPAGAVFAVIRTVAGTG